MAGIFRFDDSNDDDFVFEMHDGALLKDVLEGSKAARNAIAGTSAHLADLRKQILSSASWHSSRGVIPIRSMDREHLENCNRMLGSALNKQDEEIRRIGKAISEDPSQLEYHYAQLALLVGSQVVTEAQIERFNVELTDRGSVVDMKKKVRSSVIVTPPGEHIVDTIKPHVEGSTDNGAHDAALEEITP